MLNEVCGKDKKTYGNACLAACAGVEVVSLGACKGKLTAFAFWILPVLTARRLKLILGRVHQTLPQAAAAALTMTFSSSLVRLHTLG